MLVVATYDVDVTQKDGAKRLRHVAKICEKWGIRVQNSVFELLVSQSQFIRVKNELLKTINPETDSIRFYQLGNHFETKISVIGKQPIIETGKEIIL